MTQFDAFALSRCGSSGHLRSASLSWRKIWLEASLIWPCMASRCSSLLRRACAGDSGGCARARAARFQLGGLEEAARSCRLRDGHESPAG